MKMNSVVMVIIVIVVVFVVVGCGHNINYPLIPIAPVKVADSTAISNAIDMDQFLLDNPDIGEDGIEEDEIEEGIGLMGIRSRVVAEILKEMDTEGAAKKFGETNKKSILTVGE